MNRDKHDKQSDNGRATTSLTLGSVPMTLAPEEIERYSRQLILPGFTLAKQEELKSSTVVIDGSLEVAARYLAAAGVGEIIFHGDGNCLESLKALNPTVKFNSDQNIAKRPECRILSGEIESSSGEVLVIGITPNRVCAKLNGREIASCELSNGKFSNLTAQAVASAIALENLPLAK